MALSTGGGERGTERALIEAATASVIAGAPQGWHRVHAHFEPTANPPAASAVATWPDGREQQLWISPETLELINDFQRARFLAGTPWRVLTIDVDGDGLLSAATDSVPLTSGVAARRGGSAWIVAAFSVITVACLVASAVLFVFFWTWSPPPRADVIPVPPPPPRQHEAFDVLTRWYEAENKRDVATMRQLACAEPSPSVLNRISTIDYYGQDEGFTYPDAITRFEEQPGRVRINLSVRIHPLDERMEARVADAQKDGGFLLDVVTLADEAGQFKVCDVELSQ